MDGAKHTINAYMGLYCSRAKIKALHPQQMQGKRKAPPAWAGWISFIFFFKVCKGGAKLLRFFFCQVIFCAELVSVCASPSSIIQGGGTARNVF
jgi:hypothetical protein